jgi:hypothetical protein
MVAPAWPGSIHSILRWRLLEQFIAGWNRRFLFPITKLGANHYQVSLKRHTGRWEKTPFFGTLEETLEVVRSVMQHLIAAS